MSHPAFPPVCDEDFSLAAYRYDLPPEQIAQFPPEVRGGSRLLVLPRQGEFCPEHHQFAELPDLLPEGALLVANNSRVLQARLLGTRGTGGKVEFLLLTPLPLVRDNARRRKDVKDGWTAEVSGLVRCGGSIREGESVAFGAGITVTVLESGPFGQRRVRLDWEGDLAAAFAATGHIPLPPYIRRSDDAEDLSRYQTVYAREDKLGSVAAPTAGLHFTQPLRDRLAERGMQWAEVTLYVGYGTFSPVRCDDIRQHRMHREYIEVPEETVAAIRRARSEKRPVIAVGTTSVRALEGAAEMCGGLQPYTGWTDLFMYPGRRFRVVDGMITNFHLPESSLLLLVSAFAGRRRILAAYEEAVRSGYRFFSYGDAMLIR